MTIKISICFVAGSGNDDDLNCNFVACIDVLCTSQDKKKKEEKKNNTNSLWHARHPHLYAYCVLLRIPYTATDCTLVSNGKCSCAQVPPNKIVPKSHIIYLDIFFMIHSHSHCARTMSDFFSHVFPICKLSRRSISPAPTYHAYISSKIQPS